MNQLHVFFFPFMAHGHMLPTLDMAKLFSSRGIKTTLIATHHHAPTFNKAIERSLSLGFQISVRVIRFPATEVGLPEGFGILDQVMSVDTLDKFMAATALLQEPVEQLLRECRPHCLVYDMFFPWTTDSAEKFGIPRLYFPGSSSFTASVSENLRRYKPYKNVSSEADPFLLPDFPHQVKFTRAQLPESHMHMPEENETDFAKILLQVFDSNERCYGGIFNTFYDLEPDYVNYNKDKFGARAWNIGPLLLQVNGAEGQAQRGKESSIDQQECLKWLDSKEPNSVIFACFGSLAEFTASQLHEIASGLEGSGQQFIWVVRSCVDEKEEARWLPNGFEERMRGRGLVIKGWAPQILILQHEAVGAFVTHCGWNSTLEAVCAGVPMVTCPLFGDQFFNEKLLTEILKIGVPIGAKKNTRISTDAVNGDALAKAVNRIMVGEEAVEMRNRAKALTELARKAIEEGGSSYLDFNSLIQELSAYHSAKKQV